MGCSVDVGEGEVAQVTGLHLLHSLNLEAFATLFGWVFAANLASLHDCTFSNACLHYSSERYTNQPLQH